MSTLLTHQLEFEFESFTALAAYSVSFCGSNLQVRYSQITQATETVFTVLGCRGDSTDFCTGV
jgi:hypothetical protein